MDKAHNQILGSERHLVVPANLLAIRDIGPWLAEATDDLAVLTGDEPGATEARSQLELALQELAVNIVTHGYGDSATGDNTIALAWLVTRHPQTAVTITARDAARPYVPQPERQSEPGTPSVHGFGLMLIEQLVDSFTHEREGDTNVWTLVLNF